jgi:acetolactate synthase-1/3 small subunit
MTLGEHLERELALLKLRMRPEQTDAVRGYVVRAGGRVLDPSPDGFIVELTASEAEVNAFVADLAGRTELREVVRSGALGISRGGN